MSDNFLKLIPTEPSFVPSLEARQKARRRLRAFAPEADRITSSVTKTPGFIDQGSNWERTLCPLCQKELPDAWCMEALEAASKKDFADLNVALPCCGGASSLNNLIFEWPAGFARFVLEVENPNIEALDERQKRYLGKVLGCSLRIIWAHY